jgi:5-methylcytosine-specific restriction endonuclease McrA
VADGVRGFCRWCGSAVGGRRRTFCSDACVHQWRLRSSTSYLRDCVFERDRGVCAICRLDTVGLRRRVMRLPFAERMRELRALLQRGAIARRRKTWWEADHILAVVEGGDSNLENIRTLCIPCHRAVTKELRARRAGLPVALSPVGGPDGQTKR